VPRASCAASWVLKQQSVAEASRNNLLSVIASPFSV
jgi:hypothetical protein